jgi:hypothetical protein
MIAKIMNWSMEPLPPVFYAVYIDIGMQLRSLSLSLLLIILEIQAEASFPNTGS